MQLIELKVKKQLLTEELQKRRAEIGDQNSNYFNNYFDHKENTIESLASAMEKKKKYIDLYNKINALVSELNDIDYCIVFYNAFIRLYDGSNECKINYKDCSGIQSQTAQKLICDSFALSKLNVVFKKNIYINDSYAIVRADESSANTSSTPNVIAPTNVESSRVYPLVLNFTNSTYDAIKEFEKVADVKIDIHCAENQAIAKIYFNKEYSSICKTIENKKIASALEVLIHANCNVEYIFNHNANPNDMICETRKFYYNCVQINKKI